MKKMRKIVTIVLTLALLMGTVISVGAPAEAKLSGTKKYTMLVGNQAKWVIFGAGGKKIKFKSSNKKIATISKSGIIKAKKKGKCTLTAKVGKKSLKCKLTVKAATKITTPAPVVTKAPVVTTAPVATPTAVPDTIINNQLAANIAITKTVLSSGKLLYTVTNNNTLQIWMTKLNMMYYNAQGGVQGTGYETVRYLDPGETRYVVVRGKTEYDLSKTVASITCEYSKYLSKAKVNVTCTAEANSDGDVIITIVNPNTVKANMEGVVLFKDATGAVVDAKDIYEILDPGATKFTTVSAPYDLEYKDIPYTSYEIRYYADTDN